MQPQILPQNEMKRRIQHRMKHSPEYKSWAGMKTRCLNPNSPSYANYGGRGIKICQQWIDNFETFYADMGPSFGMSIERTNVNGDYEPTNCVWLPMREQARNKRNNRRITDLGEEKLLTDWAQQLGISPSLLHYHLSQGKTIGQIHAELHSQAVVCVCGKIFNPKRKWQKYCTDACKESQRNKRRYGVVAA